MFCSTAVKLYDNRCIICTLCIEVSERSTLWMKSYNVITKDKKLVWVVCAWLGFFLAENINHKEPITGFILIVLQLCCIVPKKLSLSNDEEYGYMLRCMIFLLLCPGVCVRTALSEGCL